MVALAEAPGGQSCQQYSGEGPGAARAAREEGQVSRAGTGRGALTDVLTVCGALNTPHAHGGRRLVCFV